jgi:hypothetical protein
MDIMRAHQNAMKNVNHAHHHIVVLRTGLVLRGDVVGLPNACGATYQIATSVIPEEEAQLTGETAGDDDWERAWVFRAEDVAAVQADFDLGFGVYASMEEFIKEGAEG